MRRIGCLLVFFLLVGSVHARTSVFAFSWSGSAKPAKDAAKDIDLQLPGRTFSIYGYRLGCFAGGHQELYGIATSALCNSDASVGGFQIGGLVNIAEDATAGVWQIAGGGNEISKRGNGIQISGFANASDGEYFNGLQVAGLTNVSMGEYNGAQIGLVNMATKMTGLQIGVMNRAKSLCGVQLGLINIESDAKVEFIPVFRVGW